MKTIQIGSQTRPAHQAFINWLNGLLNQYVSSFYDQAIQNILTVSFIKEHRCFIQELYTEDGTELVGFMSVLPTDTTGFILMVHNVDGVPYLYNNINGADLFNFDAKGNLSNFFENVTVLLNDVHGNSAAECYITFREMYGANLATYIVKRIGINVVIGEGILDFPFEGKTSGSYMVQNTPLDAISKYEVTNITKAVLEIDVPILKDFNIRYTFKPNIMVVLPVTDHVDYFLRQMKEIGNLKYRLVNE